MSVLIRGMKMPRGCIACPFMFFGRDDYLMWCKWIGGPLGEWSKYRDKWRHPACPLVEVPTPHGRLIDGDDAFIDADERGFDFWSCDADIDSAQEFLRAQPTIIEAEEGEEA